jgi:hypothetical protein
VNVSLALLKGLRAVLRALYVKREEMKGEWGKLKSEKLHNLFFTSDSVRVIIWRRVRCAGHVIRKGEMKNVYKILVGRPEGKKPFWKA